MHNTELDLLGRSQRPMLFASRGRDPFTTKCSRGSYSMHLPLVYHGKDNGLDITQILPLLMAITSVLLAVHWMLISPPNSCNEVVDLNARARSGAPERWLSYENRVCMNAINALMKNEHSFLNLFSMREYISGPGSWPSLDTECAIILILNLYPWELWGKFFF